MDKNIYIDNTVSLWGGQNGEVNMELEDGTVLTFNAYNLMRDLPSIVRVTFDEVHCEKKNIQENYKELAKFITK
jgi:predicted transcriptional regulator